MNKNRNRATIRLKTTTTTNNTRLISIIQCTTFTSCQNAACSYELFPLMGGLCFGGKHMNFLLLTDHTKQTPSGNAVVSAYNTGCPPNTGFDR